jgi:hypothetical protein
MRNKLYIHNGAGHYIGSRVIVCATCREDAESLIRNELDKAGLRDEPLNVTEAKFSKNMVILFEDGDY